MPRRAFALGCHPDDIEFMMAGTLILLKRAGYEIHYMNVANGSCGTACFGRDEIVRIRRDEARAAAELIGAVFHKSLASDIEVFYEKQLLAKVGAVMREVGPEILLVHAPNDYMEDHQNAARLAVTAAFCRSMPNFPTDPPQPIVEQDVTVYHAQPHSNRDALWRLVSPEIYVDITTVVKQKREMLACHVSQKNWLDESQGMDSYLIAMEDISRDTGAMSQRYEYAEGWRRRSHFGFCLAQADPLSDALAELVYRNPSYDAR